WRVSGHGPAGSPVFYRSNGLAQQRAILDRVAESALEEITRVFSELGTTPHFERLFRVLIESSELLADGICGLEYSTHIGPLILQCSVADPAKWFGTIIIETGQRGIRFALSFPDDGPPTLEMEWDDSGA